MNPKFYKFCKFIIICGVFVTGRKLYDLYQRWKYNYPPGPCGLPLIGNLMSMLDGRIAYVRYLKAKYGDICMIKFGTTNCIIVNNYETCKTHFKKKIFQNHTFISAPEFETFVELNGKKMWERRTMLHHAYIHFLNWRYVHSFVMSNKININKTNNIDMFQILSYYLFSLTFTGMFGTMFMDIPLEQSQEFRYYKSAMDGVHESILYGTLFGILFGPSNNLYGKYGKYPRELKKLTTIITNWINEYELKRKINTSSVCSDECCVKTLFEQIEANNYSKRLLISDIISLFIGTSASMIRMAVHC
eukprot:107657_1